MNQDQYRMPTLLCERLPIHDLSEKEETSIWKDAHEDGWHVGIINRPG